MDSPSSELHTAADAQGSDNPIEPDYELDERINIEELNRTFQETSSVTQPPTEILIITMPSPEVLVGEQSETNSLNRQEISNPSTLSAVPAPSEIIGPLIFEKLPDKVMVKILQLVPRDDLEDLKEVSSQFRLLIDARIGLSIVIGSPNDFLVDGSVEKLKEVGVASCTVINLVNTRVPDKPYRYPQILQSLTLQGYISEKNFIRLISTTPQVRKLQVDISTLSVVEFQDINLHEHFPNLSVLKVTSEGNFFSECTSTQWLTACYSLIGLLEGKYPNLKQLNISIPYISNIRNVDFDFARTLFSCLHRHGSTLNRLKIEYGGFYEDFEDDEEENAVDIADDAFYSQAIDLKNLEYFAISLIIDDDEAVMPRNPGRWVQKLQQQWIPILNCQKKIQSCTVNHSIFFPTSTVATLSSNNKQSLKVLHWKFQKNFAGERIVVDCAIFQDCSSLVELVLSGPTTEDLPFLGDDQSWWTRPVFSNLARLPQSIEKLKLDFCEVAGAQFLSFPKEFPNLKCLSLDINCHDPWGISVDTLCGLLEKESLKLLILQKSFNIKSVHHNSNSDSIGPFGCVLKALLSAWSRNTTWLAMSTFALRRNVNGQWENAGGAVPNIHRDMFPTPMPEGVRTLAVLPIGPVPPRRVMFDFDL